MPNNQHWVMVLTLEVSVLSTDLSKKKKKNPMKNYDI